MILCIASDPYRVYPAGKSYYSFAGMNLIVAVDLCTFAIAFVALLLFGCGITIIRIRIKRFRNEFGMTRPSS